MTKNCMNILTLNFYNSFKNSFIIHNSKNKIYYKFLYVQKLIYIISNASMVFFFIYIILKYICAKEEE